MPAGSVPAPMAVGEVRKAKACAWRSWNHTGIKLTAGAQYTIRAQGTWFDLHQRSGPEGHGGSRWPFTAFAKHKRDPAARWFCLMGTLDRDESTTFRIGQAHTLTSPRNGELTCWANDVRRMYWNNWRSVRMTVTRSA